MIIKTPKLFFLSLVMLIISVGLVYLLEHIIQTTATRDFDFGPAFASFLAYIQIVLSLLGIIFSLAKKR